MRKLLARLPRSSRGSGTTVVRTPAQRGPGGRTSGRWPSAVRASAALAVVLAGGCSTPAPPPPKVTDAAPPAPLGPAAPAAAAPAPEVMKADTPRTTAQGASFIAPAGWSVVQRGPATILEAPEGDSRLALVDVQAKDADAAVAAAWAAYQPDAKRPLKSTTSEADKDGWQDQRVYDYLTSPNERRDVAAGTKRSGDTWTVWIYDMSQPTGGKRGAQVRLVFDRLFPKGYTRESFAGRTAHPLDAARVKELGAFVERGREALGVPGVAIGLIQNGKIVFEGGFGPRELGKKPPVDQNTLFIIASNTKAMTTLMLGKLVDEKKLTWETPATQAMPSFRLGDADTTSKVQVKHLICACTGLPRQDYEWLLNFKDLTPAGALSSLATMQPTSKFGEMFQYSNPLAAAAGYLGGYVHAPKLEPGAAYDDAMKKRVFGPLGMTATTFDFKRALAANHASAHAPSVDDEPALAVMDANYSIVPVRPAGGAWSNVHDVLKYVQMELAKGALPNGQRYISESVLLERRAPQVAIGKDETYGMGLEVNTAYGTPVVHHGGSMIGYKSDMMWLPDHGVGAVILTNSDAGGVMTRTFRRKLLEVLFDGRPEADADLATMAKAMHQQIVDERKLLTLPPDEGAAGKLAAKYHSQALGDVAVSRAGAAVTFDFGEWKSPVASRKNPDGTVSFITTVPGMNGFEFVVGEAGGKRTLVLRDAQHQYPFTEI
jgi:CubicO group peptidase (beta-lactamase class C family)